MNLRSAAVLLCVMALSGSAVFLFARTDPGGQIRSQTNETLVPVLVLDKSRALKFHHMQPVAWRKRVVASGYKLWESIAITGLRRADFHLYEDGQQQKIQSVLPETTDSTQYLASNFGRYWQATGVAGGSWSVPDWFPLGNGETLQFANSERVYQVLFDSSAGLFNPYSGGRISPLRGSAPEVPPTLVNLPPLPWYMIAYTRPLSPPGSCHRITVKVDRSDSLIYSRSEYCDASDSAADALADTKLGVRLKAELLSKKKSALPLRMIAIPVFTSTGARRIRLSVDAKLDAMTISCNSRMEGSGIVGLIYSQGGTLAKRFSDGLFYAPRKNSMYWDTEWFTPAGWPGKMACSDVFYEPTRYQTQLDLAPGTYRLEVGVWNGHKFGRAELPLTVDRENPKKLSIGGVALVGRFRKIGPKRKVLPRSLADRYPPLVAKGLEIAPAANTRFESDVPLHFYLQVYEPQETGAERPTVYVDLQIRDAKTGRTIQQLPPLDAGPYATPRNPVIAIVSSIDVRELGNGSYELRAQATDSTGAVTPWQSADFTIEK